jgi:hypothetical protein
VPEASLDQHSQLAADCTGDGGIRPDIDSPAITSPAVNETSGDKRKVRASPAALPVNGINESGTSPRGPEPVRPCPSGALERAVKAAGILPYSTDSLLSRDIIGDSASCVFDSVLTQAFGQR